MFYTLKDTLFKLIFHFYKIQDIVFFKKLVSICEKLIKQVLGASDTAPLMRGSSSTNGEEMRKKCEKNRKIAFFYDFLFDKCKKWVILYDITKRSGIAQW